MYCIVALYCCIVLLHCIVALYCCIVLQMADCCVGFVVVLYCKWLIVVWRRKAVMTMSMGAAAAASAVVVVVAVLRICFGVRGFGVTLVTAVMTSCDVWDIG